MRTPVHLSVAVATTGLFSETYTPRLLEIAAVAVIPKMRLIGPRSLQFHSLVRQPESALQDSRAVQAERFHGITPTMSRGAPTEEEAMKAFRLWREGTARDLWDTGEFVLVSWRGYNSAFIRGTLASPGWWEALGPSGTCIMEETTEVLGEAGLAAKNRDGSYRYVGLRSAVETFRGRPIHLHEKSAEIPPTGGPGRALKNAILAGYAAVGASTMPRPEQAPQPVLDEASGWEEDPR